MPLFLVVPQPDINSAKLGPAIAEKYTGAFSPLGGDAGWVIVARATPEEISEKLGIKSGENGAALVAQVATYYGRANPNLWAWIDDAWGRLDA